MTAIGLPKRTASGREIQGGALDVKSVVATVGHPVPLPNRQTSATAEAGSKKGCFYKPLPREFRRNGFIYQRIACEGDAAIYSQTRNGSPDPAVCFEVIRILRRSGFQIGGRFVEPAEVYPRSELWGIDGFTFTNRNKAFAKFTEISLEEPASTGKEVK